jgi:hypothetical protein
VAAENPKLIFGLALGLVQMQGDLCHANAIGLGLVLTNQEIDAMHLDSFSVIKNG